MTRPRRRRRKMRRPLVGSVGARDQGAFCMLRHGHTGLTLSDLPECD